MVIFEVINKKGKKIQLTSVGWKHISPEHPEVTIEEIKLTIEKPTKINQSKYDPNVQWHYRFNKNIKRYLMVSVKFLNGEGFIITAFYMKNIK